MFSADGGAIAISDDDVYLGRWSNVDDVHATYAFEMWEGDGFSGPVGVDPAGNIVGPGGALWALDLRLPAPPIP